jgi:hypothetical protein
MKNAAMFREDLALVEQYGTLDTPEGKERVGKIAVIAAADGIAPRHLPLYPVRRWRKSLDDLAEATALAERGGPLSGRALAKCEKRLAAAEENLDDYLDKIIRKYHLEEEWEAYSSMTEEDWAERTRPIHSPAEREAAQ